MPRYDTRQSLTRAHEAAWVDRGATSFEIMQHVLAIAVGSAADFFIQMEDGHLVPRSWESMSPEQLATLKAVETETESYVDESSGDRVIIKQKLKITCHDKLKALQMVRELYGLDEIRVFKTAAQAEGGNKLSRGLQLDLSPKEFAVGLDYVAPQYRDKTEEDWAAELGV